VTTVTVGSESSRRVNHNEFAGPARGLVTRTVRALNSTSLVGRDVPADSPASESESDSESHSSTPPGPPAGRRCRRRNSADALPACAATVTSSGRQLPGSAPTVTVPRTRNASVSGRLPGSGLSEPGPGGSESVPLAET
jgi:hypothetical protein